MTKEERTKALNNAQKRGWTLERIAAALNLDTITARMAHGRDNRDSHVLNVIDEWLEKIDCAPEQPYTPPKHALYATMKPNDIMSLSMRDLMLGVSVGTIRVMAATNVPVPSAEQ